MVTVPTIYIAGNVKNAFLGILLLLLDKQGIHRVILTFGTILPNAGTTPGHLLIWNNGVCMCRMSWFYLRLMSSKD